MDRSKNSSEQWDSKLFRTLNSAICFTLAYVLFNYLYWFAMVFVAKFYKFDSFVYYYGVKMILNSSQWNTSKVSFIYSAGPLTCLFFAMLCFFLYRTLKRVASLFNVFLLWGFVIGTAIFVSQGLILWLGGYNYGSPYYQGLAVVFSWWRVPDFVIHLLAIPFLALFIYLSLNYGKPFLLFSFSFSRINKLARKRKYFFETALVPFALGALITTILTYPMNIQVHAINLLTIGTALLIAWYTLTNTEILRGQLLRYNNLQLPSIVLITLIVLVCFLVYFIFRGMYVAF